jgi:hypothetical protein
MDKQSLTFMIVFLILAAVVVASVFFAVGMKQSPADFAPTGTVSGSQNGSTDLTESAFYTETAKSASSASTTAP